MEVSAIWQSHRKPESQKCGSIADEWNGDTGDEGDDVWYDDGGEPALVVREPAEEECSGDGTGKEERLGQCGYPGLVTDPVHVRRDGPVVVGQVVLPAQVAGGDGPAGVGRFGTVGDNLGKYGMLIVDPTSVDYCSPLSSLLCSKYIGWD